MAPAVASGADGPVLPFLRRKLPWFVWGQYPPGAAPRFSHALLHPTLQTRRPASVSSAKLRNGARFGLFEAPPEGQTRGSALTVAEVRAAPSETGTRSAETRAEHFRRAAFPATLHKAPVSTPVKLPRSSRHSNREGV